MGKSKQKVDKQKLEQDAVKVVQRAAKKAAEIAEKAGAKERETAKVEKTRKPLKKNAATDPEPPSSVPLASSILPSITPFSASCWDLPGREPLNPLVEVLAGDSDEQTLAVR